MHQEIYRETSIHGSVLFPFECYIQNSDKSLLVKDHHWHDEMEWIYIVEGKIQIEINLKQFVVSENNLICVPRGALHKIRTLGKCLYYAYVFQFQMLQASIYDICESEYLMPLLNGEISFLKVIKIVNEDQKRILLELEKIVGISKTKELAWQIEVKASLLKVIALLIKFNFIEKEESIRRANSLEKSEKMKKVLTYIREHLQEKIYIQDLSGLISYNKTYFCRYFKETTGFTPVEYIIHLRIEEATRMIRETDYKIIDICYMSGFENISYFIKKFKEQKKFTPKKYEELCKKTEKLK